MSDKESQFLVEIRRYLIGASITIIFGAAATWIGFYYNTSYTIKTQSEKIKLLEMNKADRELIENKLEYIQRDITEIKMKLP